MNLPAASCVLIADSRYERFPLLAAQFAALRGVQCWRMDLAGADFSDAGFGPKVLLAMSHGTLASFNPAEMRALKAAVVHGASLYVRGGFLNGQTCSLTPFGLGAFRVHPCQATDGYQLCDHILLPQVLRNEAVTASLELPGAQIADSAAQALALRGSGAAELPFIFAVMCGSGVVIYDLTPDEVPHGAMTPIVQRLANPATRCFEVGALAAINYTTGRAPSTVGTFNLVLDDRPRNFDYFNVARATRWLGELERLCPGIHVDFGWSPQYDRPSARYIKALKRFNVGFVWHGLYRHVNHRRIEDLAADYREGFRLVEKIARQYAVRFQPIMILPFQEANADILVYLNHAGFLASVFDSKPRAGLENSIPAFMHHSTPLHELYLDYLPVLRRYPAPVLNRDQMIANAALDLPIIASAHPLDVGLRRYAALYRPFERVSTYFNALAAFAREKHLRPLSLEEIAREMIALPRPTLKGTDSLTTMETIDIAV